MADSVPRSLRISHLMTCPAPRHRRTVRWHVWMQPGEGVAGMKLVVSLIGLSSWGMGSSDGG